MIINDYKNHYNHYNDYKKNPGAKFGSWVVEPMPEISRFTYIKSRITLHVKSNAENVNLMLGASHCFFKGV